MLRDNLVGLIEPMLSSAGPYPLALCTEWKQSSDDRPPCLENPRPEGAESTLTENAPSPFHAEPKQNDVFNALQIAAVCLSVLVVFVGLSVLMVMLKIRGEQYLYVKAVNGTRQYFKEKYNIEADKYLALPSDMKRFKFGPGTELSGRTFWEAMVVILTTSLLLAFLSSQLALRHLGWQYCAVVSLAGGVFVVFAACSAWFVRCRLQAAIDFHGLSEVRYDTRKEP